MTEVGEGVDVGNDTAAATPVVRTCGTHEYTDEEAAKIEAEFEALEIKIAELEGAQSTLTAQLSNDAVVNDPAKFRETTNAVEKLAKPASSTISMAA